MVNNLGKDWLMGVSHSVGPILFLCKKSCVNSLKFATAKIQNFCPFYKLFAKKHQQKTL